MAQSIADRIAALDWPGLQARLDEDGFAQTPPILTASERAELAGSFDDGRFRSTIEMRRHRFGEGTYRYFDHPLPEPIAAARRALYPPLAETANRWAERLGQPADLPPGWTRFSTAATVPARSGQRPSSCATARAVTTPFTRTSTARSRFRSRRSRS
jgi:hypothetical protein